MDVNECTQWRPVVKPFGICQVDIDASMAHGGTEVVMPVGTMNGIIFEKVHDVGHIIQAVIVTQVIAGHVLSFVFNPGAELAGYCWKLPHTTGY